VKRRERQTSLAAVKLPFTRQQARTQQSLRSLQRQTLHEILAVGYQHVFDQVGVIQKERFLRPKFEVRDISIVARQVLKERERPTAIGEQTRQGDSTFWSRRMFGGRQANGPRAQIKRIVGQCDSVAQLRAAETFAIKARSARVKH
jgi:hypothetical protein